MDKIIKNILKSVENEGYEAYLVGGFVRDFILGNVTYDVDICTNALPKEIVSIFPLNQSANGYGGFNFKIKQYNIDITTYRKEIKYVGRNPIEIEYISSLFEDIKRRDFTVNSLCMDKNGNIIDLLNAHEDLNKKIIRSIGNVNKKFEEDPLRMLRAIRFASVIDFEIEKNTYDAIIKYKDRVKELSNERVKEEVGKILNSPNFMKGLNLLEETGLKEILNINYKGIKYISDILGMWAQIDAPKISFSKTEQDNIARIKQIIKKQEINNFDLFNDGLYVCQVAAEILGINKKEVNNMFKNLPIESMKDIEITGKEVMDILHLEPSKKISEIINDVKIQILNGNLKNKKSEIIKYIIGSGQNE